MFDFTPMQLVTFGFLVMAITVGAILIGAARDAMHGKAPQEPPLEPKRGWRRHWPSGSRRGS